MISPIDLLMFIPALVLGVFVGYGFVLFLLSLVRLATAPRLVAPARPRTRFVVLVPAHNEEVLIAQTATSILGTRYPRESVDLIVIADNCSDRTAQIARECGATCFERTDLERRGKPYALDWAIRQLDFARYDALVIIDADTRIHADFFHAMDGHLQRGHRVLQGYFGVMNPDQNWLTRLSLMPGALKFKLHFPGKELLGLSCPLAGNGMCFDIDIIRRYGWNAFSITENWEYWVQLTLEGIVVDSAPDAVIYSQVAKSLDQGGSQRMRWMKGRILTLVQYGRRLFTRALTAPDRRSFDALLELMRPSHANLAFGSIVYLLAALALWRVTGQHVVWLWLAGGFIAAQLLYFFVAFIIDRPPLKTWLALLMVPWYLVWKLIISARGLLTLRDRAWVRTRRNE
jgi:cellulose synthase/poly-beta-1,6-N-acetylglucosamine synthase-like glycosyltransferase